MKLYVANLSFNTEERALEELFATVGEVASVHFIRDHATGRSRGFGVVEMRNAEQGRAAGEKLDQDEFQGRRRTVNEARPQERRDGGGGGGGGRGGGGGGGRQRRDPRW